MLNFFIERPIFASVCSFLILMAGLLTIPQLPIENYPDIAPPSVQVTAIYTGANAATVETTVTSLIEQQINGVEGMRYMTSSSTASGISTVTVFFELGRNPDLAAVDVKNRVSVVESQLPPEVQALGVRVEKVNNNFALAIGFEAGPYSEEFVNNYIDLYVRDRLKRVKGVSDVVIFGGGKYSMRLWLDPERLARRGITAGDVVKSLNEQNIQVPAGQIGSRPQAEDQMYQINIRAQGRLQKPEEFAEVIVRSNGPDDVVKVKDVGRVELGVENYNDAILRFNGKESVGIGILPLPKANILEVASGVLAELELMKPKFPPGLSYRNAFSNADPVKASIREVLTTLVEAILLVVLVMFLFLQSARITLIPLVTIPVSLIGTAAGLYALGYSMNTLTLFGITLATGLVVDDAIVVIENIERVLHETRSSVIDAAKESLREIASAVIATTLVLGAVFIPVTFFPGTTGLLYKQFAVTIAISVGISAFIALTLTPALSVLLMREDQHGIRWLGWFNTALEWVRRRYEAALHFVIRLRWVVVAIFLIGIGLTVLLYRIVPTGFVPTEDQGYFIMLVQGPEGSSFRQTQQTMMAAEAEMKKIPEITDTFAVAGFGFGGGGPSKGVIFATLKPWDQRKGKGQDVMSIIGKLSGPFAQITSGQVIAFPPPPVNGLGSVGGFQYELQDLSGGPIENLDATAQKLTGAANQDPNLAGVFTGFKSNSPQLLVEVDRERAKSLNVDLTEIFSTISINFGSAYVNNFELFNRNYRVYVQADEQFRSKPSDLEKYYVRSRDNKMIPLSNVVKISRETAPPIISHYNLFRSVEINGNAKPGVSSGQAIAAMENLSKSVLPANMGYEWSGLSREELSAGNQTYLIFGLGILCLFLILAAQYESLVAPFIVLFSVPLAVLGALAFNFVRGLPNDIFTQIGLVMLIGLSSKNGILIVEFANQLRAQGASPREAVIKAAETRLRPILMTSLAFIFGLLPLLFSTGAGALARHSLATAVIGGMLVSTALNLFVIPVFYVLFVRDTKRRDDEPLPDGPSFEEGNYSVSEVFEEEQLQADENEKKGLVSSIDEENKGEPPATIESEKADGLVDATKENVLGSSSPDEPTKKE
jgi:HAE1 family hydrophobic/amphiphilic exporter-1